MEINTAVIAEVAGFIVLIGGAGAYLKNAVSPLKDLIRKLDNDKRRLDSHDLKIALLQADCKEILKTQNVMMSHMVTNNNTGELKKRQDEINEYLINR